MGHNSELFYNIKDNDDYSAIEQKVTKAQDFLLKGYGWIELGIKRIIKQEKVFLILSETEIKSYD